MLEVVQERCPCATKFYICRLKTPSRMTVCWNRGMNDRSSFVTMYRTQVGLVPKGTTAKTKEGGRTTLCKWINLYKIPWPAWWWWSLSLDLKFSVTCLRSWKTCMAFSILLCTMIHMLVLGWFFLCPQLCYCCFLLSYESENYCFNLMQVQVHDSVSKIIEMIFREFLVMIWPQRMKVRVLEWCKPSLWR